MHEADRVADAPDAPPALGKLTDAAEAEADVGVLVVIGAGFFRHGSGTPRVRLLLKRPRFRRIGAVREMAPLSP